MSTAQDVLAASQWLQTGKAPKERGLEVALGMVLLQGKVAATADALGSRALGEDIELALLELAEAQARWDLVGLLAASARNKSCQKAARKVVFRAKARGITVPEPAPAARKAVAMAQAPEPLPSYCTGFDRAGHHVVALGGWSPADSSWSLAGVIGPDDVLRGVYFSPGTSRTKLRAMLDRVTPGTSVCSEVAPALAAGLLRRALDAARKANTMVDGDLLRANRMLADAAPLHTLEVALDSADEARLDALCDQAHAWIAEPALAAWATALRQVVDGGTGTLDAEAVDAALTEARRDQWARRLEISALLVTRGPGNDAALAAIATARALRDAAAPASRLALVRAAFGLA